MKTNYNVLRAIPFALLFSLTSWGQVTIAQWNFNGTDAASVPGGITTPTATVGDGSLAVVGTITPSFAAGVNGSGVGSSDPATTSPPNFAWASTNYAAQGTGDRQNGIQININTTNFQELNLKFDQRLSNKAGNTYVVEYTADRTAGTPVWTDVQTLTFTPAPTGTGDTWYNQRTVDLSTLTDLNNNPNAALRILAAYDPTSSTYLASTSTSTYDGSGTVRFDMITVTGVPMLATTQFETAGKFNISPNPSNKEIVTLSHAQDIRVYDINGKLILDAKNAKTINTQSFNTGVYLIQTANGETKKLIVR